MAGVNNPPTGKNFPALLPAPVIATKQERFFPVGEPSDEELRELVNTWKAQRQEFPGWIIVPGENRRNLWTLTEHWTEHVLAAAARIAAPENLAFCYELNWRIERTLTPLFLPWADAIAKVVKLFYPFLTANEEGTDRTSIRIDNPDHYNLPWQVIRKQWVELVFALAREAREDQDQDRFNEWLGLVEPALEDEPEWSARWHHEKCLFWLGCFDLDALRDELTKWSSAPELPMWEARRASILAELGDHKEAERIAREALTTVRARIRPFVNDYQTLSQEGWIMLLLNVASSDHAATKSTSRNRLQKLSTYRCNPWEHLEFLAPTLRGEMPLPKPAQQTRVAFEPRGRIVTSHFGQTFPHLLVRPAFALLRLYEEGAVPLRSGHGTVYLEEAVTAAKWIEPYAPFWALNYRIRADASGDLESAFTRARVAGLDDRQVADLYRITSRGLQQAIREPNQGGIKNWEALSFRLIKPLCHLLSKIVFKLDEERQEEVFTLFLQMYRLPLFGQNEFVGEILVEAFNMTMTALQQRTIVARMAELLALPIPGEGGFTVRQPRRWPEPLASFEPDREAWQREEIDRSAWNIPIQNLVRIVRGGEREARARAATRLQVLGILGALSAEERDGFGQALWSRLDADSGLPRDTFFRNVSLFYLPSPEPGKARDLVRAWLLRATFAPLPQAGEKGGSGGALRESVWSGQQKDFTRTLRDATYQPLAPREHAALFIDWTAEEAAKFLEQAWAWWQQDRDLVVIDRTKAWWQDSTPTREAQALVDVMALVILPRIDLSSAEAKQGALELLQSLSETAHLDVSRAEVTALRVAPERAAATAATVRTALLKYDEEEVWNGLRALGLWARLFARGVLVIPLPQSLVADLTGRILQRTQVALDLALDVMEQICRAAPDLLTDETLDTLVEALKLLLAETKYPSSSTADDFYVEPAGTIPEELRPECRRSAAHLASALYRRFNEQGREIPWVLRQWQEVCTNDPLPEVRRAWSLGKDEES